MSLRPSISRAGIALLVAFVALAGLYLILRLVAQPAAPHAWFAPRGGEHRPLVFAHQGGGKLRPANTMLAFRHARDLGADVLDTDVRMTKDGALVLIHDPTVDRTTDGSGAVRDLSLAELQQLDAGYRFSIDGGMTYPYRGLGATVPTLEEAFRAFPDQRFGIELKDGDPVMLARALCASIRHHAMQDKVLASSFAQDRIDAFRLECPEVASSATRDEVLVFVVLHTLRLADVLSPRYQSLQVPMRAAGWDQVTTGFIESARRRRLAVQPWTINEGEELRRLIALGVDGVSTDDPGRLLNLLK